jgi:hypothetical protein
MYTNILKMFFSSPKRPHWGQLTLQFSAYQGSRGKAAGGWGWPLTSQCEVMNWWSFTVTPHPCACMSRTRQTLFSSWTWLSSWCHILILLAATVNLALISALSAQLKVSELTASRYEVRNATCWWLAGIPVRDDCVRADVGLNALVFWNTFQSLDCTGLCLKVRVHSRFYWSLDSFDTS